MRTRVGFLATTACLLVACTVPFTSSEATDERVARDRQRAPAELSVRTITCGPSLSTLPAPPTELAAATLTLDPAATWTRVASMVRGRRNAFAQVLPDDRVLVVGGTYQASESSMFAEEVTAGVESYDPSRNEWTFEGEWPCAEPPVAIAALSATRAVAITATSSSAEARMRIYDAETRTWSAGAPPPGIYRGGSSLTRLKNGELLLTGGRGDPSSWSAHIYDPNANAWRRVASLRERRSFHRAVLLDDGRVVVVGGNESGQNPIEIYDPTEDTWTVTGGEAMQPNSVLWEYGGGFVTGDHRVVVPGWQSMASAGVTRHPFALLDLDCGRWEAAVYLPRPIAWFSLVRLPTNEYAMVGGALGGTYGANTYATPVYDPAARSFRYLPPVPERRLGMTAAALKNGAILAFGGAADSCGTSCFPPSHSDAWLLTR